MFEDISTWFKGPRFRSQVMRLVLSVSISSACAFEGEERSTTDTKGDNDANDAGINQSSSAAMRVIGDDDYDEHIGSSISSSRDSSRTMRTSFLTSSPKPERLADTRLDIHKGWCSEQRSGFRGLQSSVFGVLLFSAKLAVIAQEGKQVINCLLGIEAIFNRFVSLFTFVCALTIRYSSNNFTFKPLLLRWVKETCSRK